MTGFQLLHSTSYLFRIKKAYFSITTLLMLTLSGKHCHLLTPSWDYERQRKDLQFCSTWHHDNTISP